MCVHIYTYIYVYVYMYTHIIIIIIMKVVTACLSVTSGGPAARSSQKYNINMNDV